MKKSLLALAVLGAFAGMASAQSSVTLFGIIDVNLKEVKNGDVKLKQMGTDGINSSRLGFRGTEDLGGGMSAGFWIEGGMTPDNGTAAGQNWQRRSTVSLMGGFGEVRLGRDYTPTFLVLTSYDPFGTNGVASALNLYASGGVTTPMLSGAATLVRASNSVQYFLPRNLGGLYGNAMISAGEGVAGNKYTGGRIGYAAGPFDVSAAYGVTELVTDGEYTAAHIGGSFNFGVAKVTASYASQETDRIAGVAIDGKQDTWLIGAVVPMGQGELKASYSQSKGKDAFDGTKAKLIGIGYVYNLSKRTALYGQWGQIDNDFTSFVVGQPPAATVASQLDRKSSGYELGIRHSF